MNPIQAMNETYAQRLHREGSSWGRFETLDDARDYAAFDGMVEFRAAPVLDAAHDDVLSGLLSELDAIFLRFDKDDPAKDPAGYIALIERAKALGARAKKRKQSPKMQAMLQNRDRSSKASIAQINGIAAWPHGDLLTRPFPSAEVGAPLVFSDFDEYVIPAAHTGMKDTVVFHEQRQSLAVRYAIVPAEDVLPSHDAAGGAMPEYGDEEAPGKLRVVGGNGRAAGVIAAYTKGTQDVYLDGLRSNAEALGFSAEGMDKAIQAVSKPVLVRVMAYADVSKNIADKTNSGGAAALSAVERAGNDARRVDLASLNFDEDGGITRDALIAFVANMPKSEQPALAPDGEPTREARDRLMAAVFKNAYGDDELVRLYSQAIDSEAANVLSAMAQAAPDAAKLEGRGEFDVREWLSGAARMAVNARRSGKKLSETVKQADLATSEGAQRIAEWLAPDVRSGKRMGEKLKAFVRSLVNEAEKPDEDMFGTVEKRTPNEILSELMQ